MYESPAKAAARVAAYDKAHLNPPKKTEGSEGSEGAEGFARKIPGKEEYVDKHGVCWSMEMRSICTDRKGRLVRTWRKPFKESKQTFEPTGRWKCQVLECRRKVERDVGGRGETEWSSRPVEYLCPSVPGKRTQRELAGGPMPTSEELMENGVRWGSEEGQARLAALKEKYPYCTFRLRDYYTANGSTPWRESVRGCTPEIVVVAGKQLLATYDEEGRRTLRPIVGDRPQIVVYRGQLHVRSWTRKGSRLEKI